MGGFFAVASKEDCVFDLFFGTDYHSHLGTRRGGMAVYGKNGFDRSIHNIENSPFRTKFEKDVTKMEGNLGIGCISDYEPQPLIVRSHHGTFSLMTVGKINNSDQIVEQFLRDGRIHFLEMSGGDINATELVAAIINQRENLVEGIRYAQELIEGSMTIVIMTEKGIYAARDRLGRTPVVIGKKEGAFCAAFECFAYLNLGYTDYRELGPGEIVVMTPEEVISSLENVIQLLGTYDITTIRASMGMYLVCKAIHEQTDIRVLLTGEISDELFGYKYTDFAPDAAAFQKEAQKRIHELHMYDVLRADRCISVNSLEARVPFGDLDFVKYVMAVDPELKLNTYGKGKYLLRHAFEEGDYLPDEILWREKAAFSDAVGHSMVDYLKEYAEKQYTDEEFESRCKSYTHARPFTKESLLYREIFEKYYPGQAEMVADFWMPNREWEGCDVNDPSARVLSNYGDSGK